MPKKYKKIKERRENPQGKPALLVDWVKARDLARSGANVSQVAAALEILRTDLDVKCREQFNVNISDFVDKWNQVGEAEILSKAFGGAVHDKEIKNPTILKLLLEHRLKYRPQIRIDLVNPQTPTKPDGYYIDGVNEPEIIEVTPSTVRQVESKPLDLNEKVKDEQSKG